MPFGRDLSLSPPPSLPTFGSHYPGQVFDSKGYYAGYVPASLGATVVHVIFIQAWNKIYRKVATHLTERENHRTEEVCRCQR